MMPALNKFPKAHSIIVCRAIAADAEADALTLDSTPFTGAGIGPHLGHIYASIQALARVLEMLSAEYEGE